MKAKRAPEMSRRERQIMDIVYQRGRASVGEVQAVMPDAPTYSTARALLRILEEKGHVRHEEAGGKFVYVPTRPRGSAGRQAMKRVVHTFFGGSVEQAVTALLDVSERKLSDEQMEQLQALIRKTKEEGR